VGESAPGFRLEKRMLRLGAIFIAVCMVLIAASLGAVLYLMFGLSGSESAIAALVTLAGLALYNAVNTRMRDRSDVGGHIADLSRGTADLARQVAEMSRRMSVLESRGTRGSEDVSEKMRAATAPVTAELAELSALVHELAETVADHETKLAGGVVRPAPARPASAEGPSGDQPAHHTDLGMTREELAVSIRAAVDAGRIDLYMQPILTLPQRKVRYYQAVSWLRTEDGDTVKPTHFKEIAEAQALMPRIDNILLLRSVQVVRRLLLKNRDIGLFCGISAATLNDPGLFPHMSQFMDANRAIAPSLILELDQAAWRGMGPLEQESLAALRELGFRFSMGGVMDLRMEPRDLADRGIRFVRAPAALLLGQAHAPGGDIHAADLSDLLNRFGIALIADQIEAENQVVDLLDYDLRFGQGVLFSPPRPVRAEALQSERAETIARDAASSDKSRDKPQSAAIL
jgi:cyclic-di-GMP phosphodiesterase TipF (flagellum assembly factor)